MTTPVVRIVRGEPTAEEIAALVAVIAARPAAVTTTARPESAWWRSGLPTTGARSWQGSALPR